MLRTVTLEAERRKTGLSGGRDATPRSPIAYEDRNWSEQTLRGHPSRRPPAAAPQDEGFLRSEISNPHGEEPRFEASRTMRPRDPLTPPRAAAPPRRRARW